ncbi:MAG: GGDEF domain-containing protein, partial [Myxococcales bacterium]
KGRSMNQRKLQYGVAGALLGLLAPVAWLIVRVAGNALSGGSVGSELSAHAPLYGFMAVGASMAYGAVCALYGSALDRNLRLAGLYEELGAQLAEATQRLEEGAVTDAATGLKNARYFNDWLPTECGRAARDGKPLALVVVEVDQFKTIHEEDPDWAERTMAHVAGVVGGQIRTTDVACRVSSDSLAVICPGASSQDARSVAERIRAAIAGNAADLGSRQQSLTASCGVAVYATGTTAKEFYRMADSARQIARTSGRNRVSLSPARALKV